MSEQKKETIEDDWPTEPFEEDEDEEDIEDETDGGTR